VIGTDGALQLVGLHGLDAVAPEREPLQRPFQPSAISVFSFRLQPRVTEGSQ
jgi:hypothetical protein